MPRGSSGRYFRLTALKVSKLTEPGLHADGGGLYLQCGAQGARSWLLRYRFAGKRREMGLGSADIVSLADARHKAAAARTLLAEGVDPIGARDAERTRLAIEAARAITFENAALQCIEARRQGWRNAKHAAQWTASLSTYAFPTIGRKPVADVSTDDVLKVLTPIWGVKTETASRVRSRIEVVLDWAKTMGYRTGENPARWRGHLSNLLAPPKKVRRVTHFPALPHVRVAAFMRELAEQHGAAPRALELLVLTAKRTSEVLKAEWPEFDLTNAVWTIPSEHTKTNTEHRVPLTPAALAVLEKMRGWADSVWVFPGVVGSAINPQKPLSNMAMSGVLRRMGYGDMTVHGFRSTFRDWAAEKTGFPSELIEVALSHAVSDETEAAYLRSDLFEKRRKLLDAWARYCTATSIGTVVSFTGRGERS